MFVIVIYLGRAALLLPFIFMQVLWLTAGVGGLGGMRGSLEENDST